MKTTIQDQHNDSIDVNEKVKIIINVPKFLLDFLKSEASKRSSTVTEVLRRALEDEKFLSEQEQAGAKFLLEGRDHRIREIIRK